MKKLNMRELSDHCAWLVAEVFENQKMGTLGEDERADLSEALRTILLAFKKGRPFHGICLKGDPNV